MHANYSQNIPREQDNSGGDPNAEAPEKTPTTMATDGGKASPARDGDGGVGK